MPQLVPDPWLAILTFLWLIFLTILPPKILAHKFPKELTPKKPQSSEAGTWNWPWY